MKKVRFRPRPTFFRLIRVKRVDGLGSRSPAWALGPAFHVDFRLLRNGAVAKARNEAVNWSSLRERRDVQG